MVDSSDELMRNDGERWFGVWMMSKPTTLKSNKNKIKYQKIYTIYRDHQKK